MKNKISISIASILIIVVAWLFVTNNNLNGSKPSSYLTQLIETAVDDRHPFLIQQEGKVYSMKDLETGNIYMVANSSPANVKDFLNKKVYITGKIIKTFDLLRDDEPKAVQTAAIVVASIELAE